MTAPASEDVLVSTSGVSSRTGAPFVHLRWGASVGQLTPDEARILALHIIECADAAVTDAIVVKRLRELGNTEDEALDFLQHLRALRDQS